LCLMLLMSDTIDLSISSAVEISFPTANKLLIQRPQAAV
jgi:hypothetical protein